MTNNDIVLENFINFCDDMMIAEEGFSLKSMGTMIKTVIRAIEKLIIKISNFIREKLSKKGTVYITKEAYKQYTTLAKEWNEFEEYSPENMEKVTKIINTIKSIEIKNDNLASMVKIPDSEFASFLANVNREMNYKKKSLEDQTKKLDALNNKLDAVNSEFDKRQELYTNGNAYTKNQINIKYRQTFSGDRMYDTETNYKNAVNRERNSETNPINSEIRRVNEKIQICNDCIKFCNGLLVTINYIRDNGYHVKENK